MRFRGASLQFCLLIAGLAALAMISPDCLMAQALPPATSQTGSITGIVRTAAGTPASGIRVTALRVDMVADALRAMASLAQTDSTGRYRLENVPPGRYYITAGRVDLPTFYPGTLDMTKGTVISVSSVALVSDIDIVVQDQSTTLPATRGGFGLRTGGAQGNPTAVTILPIIDGLNVVGLNFQAQNGGAPRSAGRNSGAAPPAVPAVPGQPSVQARGGSPVFINGSPVNAAWWTNAPLVARLGLTDDQKKKIEATFEQYRQTLVQNRTDLEREESVLNRMLEAETLEPAKTILSQTEKVIQARAEMERTNSKMTLEMRQNLSRAQWVQLQAESTLAGLVISNQPVGRTGGTPPAGRGGARTTTPAAPVPTPGPPDAK